MRTKPRLKVYHDSYSEYTDDTVVRVEALLEWIEEQREPWSQLSSWSKGYNEALADLRSSLDNND